MKTKGANVRKIGAEGCESNQPMMGIKLSCGVDRIALIHYDVTIKTGDKTTQIY